jgi:S-formylglutathione hydrolase
MRYALLLLTLSLPLPGAVEFIQVHGKSLEGNLSGDSPDRDVAVWLPPGYLANGPRRYPVLYLLHGFTDTVENWWRDPKHFINVPAVMEKARAAGHGDMIVVMPNAFTRFQGSMYGNSVTTGDWETYIARELVAYIDARYRTRANRESRALAGHSMGGYGTLRIAMKHPGVFSALYLMNPCCLGGDPRSNPKAEAIRTPEEIAKADFSTKADLASAAAWSPNPKKPPLFLDLPYRNGEPQPGIAAKWHANRPLAMLDQYVPQLRQYTRIGLDAGSREGWLTETARMLHERLTAYSIGHGFEIYEGGHVDRVAERLEKHVLPVVAAHFRSATRGDAPK